MKKLTYENIAHAKELNVYLEQGNRVLDALGYTDHSQKHTAKVAVTAGKILKKLGYATHTVELVRIAGYMHDLENSINRVDHAHTGALMAFHFLRDWGAPPEDIAAIISAIDQHDERSGIAPHFGSLNLSRQERRPPGPRPQHRTGNLRQTSTNTTASIMPPFFRSSTSTNIRKSSNSILSSMKKSVP